VVSADFRITHASMARKVTSNLQTSLYRLEKLQEQISSNRAINRPSDSPVGTVSALRLRAEIGRNEQIDRNLNDATAWLSTADDTLTSVVDQLNRVRDLAIQANSGALGQNERDAIAQEMSKLRDGLIGLANTKYLGRSIFGGTAAGDAYSAAGVFTGQAATIERTIAPGVRVQINLNGETVFGATGADVFTVVANLTAAVTSGTNIDTELANLDTRTGVIQQGLAEVGARVKRISTMQERASASAITLKQGLSQVEDVDLPKVIMEMRIQETAYQAALSTTAKVIQPSLVDFLR
jgi:flagellar hook-associated protein 3 FlgL